MPLRNPPIWRMKGEPVTDRLLQEIFGQAQANKNKRKKKSRRFSGFSYETIELTINCTPHLIVPTTGFGPVTDRL